MTASIAVTLQRNPKDHFRLTPPLPLIPGNRAAPTLPVRPHLRAIDTRVSAAQPGCECPLYSRIGGHYPRFDGFVPVQVAMALLVAGEA